MNIIKLTGFAIGSALALAQFDSPVFAQNPVHNTMRTTNHLIQSQNMQIQSAIQSSHMHSLNNTVMNARQNLGPAQGHGFAAAARPAAFGGGMPPAVFWPPTTRIAERNRRTYMRMLNRKMIAWNKLVARKMR